VDEEEEEKEEQILQSTKEMRKSEERIDKTGHKEAQLQE